MMSKKDREILRKIKGKNDGFTLLEVIMAISILTIGLLAVASMQVSAMRGNEMSIVYTESTERVQDRVEKLLSVNLTSLTDTHGDGVNGLNDTGVDADYSDASNPKYTVYWNVAPNYAGGKVVQGVNTIRVIVKWQQRGAPKDYTFDLLRNRII